MDQGSGSRPRAPFCFIPENLVIWSQLGDLLNVAKYKIAIPVSHHLPPQTMDLINLLIPQPAD